MSAPPLLRQASAADRPELLDLWEEAWSAARPDIDFAARRGWMAERLAELDRAGASIVLAQDGLGTIAGFVTVDRQSGYIDQLAVRLAVQGRGWAKLLLDQAKHLSPSGLRLTVNQANHRAIEVYRRAGFTIGEPGVNATSGHPVWHMRWSGRDGEKT